MLRWDMAFDPFQLIDKKARKAADAAQRSDRSHDLGGHFAAIGCGGVRWSILTYGTILMLPAMLAARHRARLPVRTDA